MLRITPWFPSGRWCNFLLLLNRIDCRQSGGFDSTITSSSFEKARLKAVLPFYLRTFTNFTATNKFLNMWRSVRVYLCQAGASTNRQGHERYDPITFHDPFKGAMK